MAKKEFLLGAVAASLLLSGAAAPAFAKSESKHHARHAAMIERLDADKNGSVNLTDTGVKVAGDQASYAAMVGLRTDF